MDSSYNLAHNDIDVALIERLDPASIGKETVFFWVSRRHWLEIVPEAIVSFWLVFSLVAVVLNVDPFASCRDIFCRSFVATLLGMALGLGILVPFGFELWRWNREIYYLTNEGWNHYLFSFRDLNFKNRNLGFLSSSEASPSTLYGFTGLHVGYVMARSLDESKRFTPLLPNPLTIQRRILEAKAYKPAPVKPSEVLWTK